MNRPVYIRQIAAISSLGRTPQALFTALMEGRTGIRSTSRFSCRHYASSLAATIPELDALPQGQASALLLEGLLQDIHPVPKAAFTILATTKGGIDQLEQQCRSGNEFRCSTGEIHQMLNFLQRAMGTTELGININAACASSTIAIAQGAALIRSGCLADCVIVAYDLISEFTHSGFSVIKAASEAHCRPFDIDRKGLNLGESAALIHLTNKRPADGDIPPVRILGSGVSSDAAHITAPARDAAGLIRACKQAFHMAGITPPGITAISAHGTGTVYNDAMELTGFSSLFNGNPPPVFSIKGATGHTLGTAGALETIVSMFALWHGCIPPTIGCRNPAPEALGSVLGSKQEIEAGGILLKTNSGFGGVNAALLIALEP